MKTGISITCLATMLLLGGGTAARGADREEGIALAIVYDTSGSMKETVADSGGGRSPKFVIANRALVSVARQMEVFATNSAGGHKIQACLFTFAGQGARESIPMGPFSADTLVRWAESFKSPIGNTPLGNALQAAGKAVLDSPMSRKHVLVITDGMNTAGPDPATVLPRLKQQAFQKETVISAHFVGFDVAARVFEPLKKQGATVVSAADEKQLTSQLQTILQTKILLEDEEPPKTK